VKKTQTTSLLTTHQTIITNNTSSLLYTNPLNSFVPVDVCAICRVSYNYFQGVSSLSFLVHFDNLMFDFVDVAALELVSAIFLLEQLQVAVDFALLLIVELTLHPGQSLGLCLLSHASLEALLLNALLEELNLILVVGLNGVDHELVLEFLSFLVLLELSLFLEELVLFELTG